jgi:hypothetical protein
MLAGVSGNMVTVPMSVSGNNSATTGRVRQHRTTAGLIRVEVEVPTRPRPNSRVIRGHLGNEGSCSNGTDWIQTGTRSEPPGPRNRIRPIADGRTSTCGGGVKLQADHAAGR